MTKLSLSQKLVKHVVGGGLSFPWDAFGIERMVRDKMISSDFTGAW
jgi:hypothetical protein